jgi:hypothetical protein
MDQEMKHGRAEVFKTPTPLSAMFGYIGEGNRTPGR